MSVRFGASGSRSRLNGGTPTGNNLSSSSNSTSNGIMRSSSRVMRTSSSFRSVRSSSAQRSVPRTRSHLSIMSTASGAAGGAGAGSGSGMQSPHTSFVASLRSPSPTSRRSTPVRFHSYKDLPSDVKELFADVPSRRALRVCTFYPPH